MRASLQHDEMLERKIKEGLEARSNEAKGQSHLKEEVAAQIDALQTEVKNLSESLEQFQGPKLEELERKLHAELGAARVDAKDVTDGEKGLAEKRLDGLQSEVRDLKEVLMKTLNQVFDDTSCNLRSCCTNDENCDH